MDHQYTTLTADEALQRLTEGNERFLRGDVHLANQVSEALKGLEYTQHPFATILGCSDSRVPPELIFDSGLGDLFVIRVAGNVFSNAVAASLQYAGAHLRTPLFVVLGHEGCGAVNAALLSRDRGKQFESRIQVLLNNMLPGLPLFDSDMPLADRMAKGVESNIRWTVQQIIDTPEAQVRLSQGNVRIVGALFEITTGQVKFLE